MRLLESLPLVRRLRREAAELWQRLSEEVLKRRAAEEISAVWKQNCESARADFLAEVAAHQQDLRDSTDALSRRFLLQNTFAKAPAAGPTEIPHLQPLRQSQHLPAREVVKQKTEVDFVQELQNYIDRRSAQ